jgi:hypothetical protein
MEQYIDEFGNLQYRPSYTGINSINMGLLNVEPYKSMAEMRGQPENRSVLDQGIPFALPNLNYRNYDLSNLFNRNTQPDFINAPQDEYASLYSLPKLDTSRFTGVDLESGYLDRAGSYDQDVYAEQEKQKGGGIGGLFRFLLGLAVPGAGFLMNLPGRGLEGIRSLNQRIQNTDFGQSRTLAEYAMKRRERKQAERAQKAMPEVYRSAKEQGFTNDRGGFSTNRADRAGTSVGSGQFSPSTSRGRSGY